MSRTLRLVTRDLQSVKSALCVLLAIVAPLGAQSAPDDTTPPQTVVREGAPAEESFFFGSNENFERSQDDKFFENAFRDQDTSSGIQEEKTEDGRWLEEDISPLFPELKVLDDVNSQTALKRVEEARRQYLEALQTLRSGEVAGKRETEHLRLDPTSETWRRNERDESLAKRKEGIVARYRQAAIGRLVRSIQLLDSVQNPAVRGSDPYVDLKADVFRLYVKQQFRSRNLGHCIEILENYMRLRPEYAREAEAHRLLAACYRNQEVITDRMQDHRSSLLFKKKKNRHLLEYARLAFGTGSPEYEAVEKRVQRDLVDVLSTGDMPDTES